MWTCRQCQNENRDEYRFCLSCGEPRPAARPSTKPQAKAPARTHGGASTVLLLLIALVLVAAIVLVIVVFPKLNGAGGTRDDEETEERVSDRRSRRSVPDSDAAEEPVSGGTSTYVIGGGSSVPSPSASESTPAVPSAEPTPIPTPLPTAAPISDSDYILPESNSRYLTEADLKDLTWEQCCLARNEIFARHGRIFVTPQIAAYFSSKSWYQGTVSAANFSEAVFNAYEKANVAFISNYETSHWGGSYY